MSMDFRILRKVIYSDEYVGLDLKQFYTLKEHVDKLRLPLLSKISEYYGHNVHFGSLELDVLDNEINILLSELHDEENVGLLRDLKKLIMQAKEEKKGIEVLTD